MSEIVIFGWSEVGKKLFEYFESNGMRVSGICDNSALKIRGGTRCKIDLPAEAVKRFPSATYYLASMYHQKQMHSQLTDLGISGENIKVSLPESVIESVKKEAAQNTRNALNNIKFQVSIARHCNLNCAMCNHFAPLSGEWFLDIGRYERDIKRMSELFLGEADHILLLGGEPLLNPEIGHFLSLTRSFFERAEISIVTNGILIKNMSEAFWKSCKDNNAIIAVTKYPISIDYDEIKSICDDKNVAFEFQGISAATRTFNKEVLDLRGEQDYVRNFLSCRWSNNCITLSEGRLFSCRTPANIDIFNQYFGRDIRLTKDDYIDIYEANSKEEILNTLTTPMPFCRYCKMDSWTYDNEFRISSCDIGEWA